MTLDYDRSCYGLPGNQMDSLIWKPNNMGAIQMTIYSSNSDMT